MILFAADPLTDSSALLLAYGPLGIFTLLAIVAGVAIYKRSNTLWEQREARFRELHAAEKARADAAEATVRDLYARTIENYVPAVVRFSELVSDVLAELRRGERR